MLYQIARKGLAIKILIAPKDCSSNGLLNFISDYERTVKFFREALDFIEKDLSLKDYHLCILPPPFIEGKNRPFYDPVNENLKNAMIKCGFVISVTNDGETRNSPVDAPELFNMELPIKLQTDTVSIHSTVLSKDLLLEEDTNNGIRCVLDASGRPCFIIVPKVHISRLRSCPDIQLYGILNLAKKTLQEYTNGQYVKIIVNAGDYMNVSHLHMKIFVGSPLFEKKFGSYEPLVRLRKCIMYRKDR